MLNHLHEPRVPWDDIKLPPQRVAMINGRLHGSGRLEGGLPFFTSVSKQKQTSFFAQWKLCAQLSQTQDAAFHKSALRTIRGGEGGVGC